MPPSQRGDAALEEAHAAAQLAQQALRLVHPPVGAADLGSCGLVVVAVDEGGEGREAAEEVGEEGVVERGAVYEVVCWGGGVLAWV